MNPADVEDLDLTVDDVAQYYYGGPIQATADGSAVWSARVISSPAIAEGTAVMGDLAKAITVIGSCMSDCELVARRWWLRRTSSRPGPPC